MEQKKHSQKFLRQRKLLIVMPLLVLPFMTLMFWALGGGKVSNANAQQVQQGFNMQLPGANLKDDKPLDKLSYYEKAASDSAKLEELMKNDPYYKVDTKDTLLYSKNNDTSLLDSKYKSSYGNLIKSPYNNSSYGDANETKVYKKLAELNTALNNAATKQTKTEDYKNDFQSTNTTNIDGGDVDRLDQMMQTMNQKNGDDPEMRQLNGMLEKILQIQHPDQINEKIKQTSEAKRGQVFAVVVNNKTNPVSFIDNGGNKKFINDTSHKNFNQPNGFYSLDDALELNDNPNAIEAVIHETQTIVNGSTVKLRLVNDVYINGVLIPKETFVFGTAALNGERLGITINSIRYKTSLFPVELSVYDLDGMDGIYIPGGIARDVAKESANRAVQDIGITTLNPSIGVQAASAGIEAAKTLFSKKVKLIKVTVKAGYHVLLRDEKQKQSN